MGTNEHSTEPRGTPTSRVRFLGIVEIVNLIRGPDLAVTLEWTRGPPYEQLDDAL